VPVGHPGTWNESKLSAFTNRKLRELAGVAARQRIAMNRFGLAESEEQAANCYFPEFDAIFLTMARTSLRSLSFRLVE
jgi:hypothetical protein